MKGRWDKKNRGGIGLPLSRLSKDREAFHGGGGVPGIAGADGCGPDWEKERKKNAPE